MVFRSFQRAAWNFTVKKYHCDIAITGAGIVGVATAYYLKKLRPDTSVLLIDASEPMALTSAQSGENYRNWWPHPVMTAFTDHSIDLMEDLARETNNLINMNRRGYLLATRSADTDKLMEELVYGYSALQGSEIRVHDSVSAKRNTRGYNTPDTLQWESAPSGVDVLNDQALIRECYPYFDQTIKTIVHIRRAGSISSQQMGQFMLQKFRQASGKMVKADVTGINKNSGFEIHAKKNNISIQAERIVNAAGPFINKIAEMLSDELPVSHTLQQKIAFEDAASAIHRQMPFAIDLDAQHIDWTEEEHQLLAENSEHQWLTREMPGAIHCRPEGGDNGTWLKLGWAYNDTHVEPVRAPELTVEFPEIVLRGAARLNPKLKQYVEKLPASLHHYGGYYTLTDENWPLVGPMKTEGSFVVGAMSGFGTMAACAAGELCARTMMDAEIPIYANALSPARYDNEKLMAEIHALSQRGIL